MKIKLFEDLIKVGNNEYDIDKFDHHINPNYWAFEDNNLKIHKILHGANKGKIIFRFFDEEEQNFNIKYSMLLGCAKILDTNYENNQKIRAITLGPEKFKNVYNNTVDSILRHFCNNDDKLVATMRDEYSKILENVPKESKNLGDIIDKLKLIKYNFKIITEPKKYNL